jgi:hypothetical protein
MLMSFADAPRRRTMAAGPSESSRYNALPGRRPNRFQLLHQCRSVNQDRRWRFQGDHLLLEELICLLADSHARRSL